MLEIDDLQFVMTLCCVRLFQLLTHLRHCISSLKQTHLGATVIPE